MVPPKPESPAVTALVVTGALLMAAAAALAADAPPITVVEFRRLSVEDPRGSLERGAQVLATPYAAAHAEWSREVLLRMARAAMLLSDSARAEELTARLDALGREKSDAIAKAYAAFVRAAAWAESGRVEDAVAAVTAAAATLDATGDPLLQAVASGEMCDVVMRASRPDLGKTHCDDARARWAVLGDPFQLARAENYLSAAARINGQLDEAIRIGKQARADFLRAGMPSLATMMDDNMAGMYLDKGDAATALKLSQGSLAHELAAGKVQHAALSRMNIARAFTKLGRHDEALASVAQALDDAKRTGYDIALPEIYEVQIAAAEAAGKPEIAVSAARAALEVTQRLGKQQAESALAEMEMRYRALEKQREVDQLTQANQIKELELKAAAATLKRERLSLALVAVAGASLAIVAVLLVLLLRAGRQRERELTVLSRTDALTGTASRRAFVQELTTVFAAAHELGSEAALWVIDADHFKRVNDALGHKAGDDVLKEIVTRIREHIRATDTLGRLGGEEFGLVLPGIGCDEAVQRAELVRCAVADVPIAAAGESIPVSVSIGVAILDPERHGSADPWLADADGALYAAKRAGRNRVEVAGR